ncbi:zinc-binding protein A33-like [Hypanus sabinus]|uniref:zinc-binding protein A33-like n=1 Tax=Hypanus sabinus TaxID=79690 RepID=UPI0028C4A16E|nr:zinc-binding protein A33-like [Hypanus sabinus]
MASKDHVASLIEEVICPICLDFFTDPVSLECEHNFCRSCITRCWERDENISCPECKTEFADRTLKASRVLGRLAEKARKLYLKPKEKESKLHCGEHEEELKLFCETDRKLICVICAAAQEHKCHDFMPIKEAVKLYKDRVKSSIKFLTEKKSVLQEMERQKKEDISRVREQSSSLQSHITSQIAEIHQILNEKEQRLLRDLRDEEERILNSMQKNLREIQENLNSLLEELSNLLQRLDKNDSVMFLQEESRQKSRYTDEAQTVSMTDGSLPVEKIDRPLLYTVWRGLFDAIKQDSVTLDVDTASPWLDVSEDRKSVRCTDTWRDLPDNGKRFRDWECVLGSEGFTSGRHYWEVQVTGSRVWSLGVAAESVERKKWVALIPETGVWTIERNENQLYVNTCPESRLRTRPIPWKVGVYLSYEFGTVSFYNASTKSHLYTITGNKFTEKLYPFFATWDKKWLRICSGSVKEGLVPGPASQQGLEAVTQIPC